MKNVTLAHECLSRLITQMKEEKEREALRGIGGGIMEETLVPLDLSDERQKEQIAELKADIERLTALAYERQEIIKEQVEEISKREHGWKLLYKEKEKLIERQEQENTALKKEAQDLHDKYGKLWDENASLKAELKSLTEAYNNTDWKNLTDEQKDTINNLTVRWGKAEELITALKAELAQNKQWVSDLEIECARSPTHKDMAELKAENEQLRFGREPLPCPRADK